MNQIKFNIEYHLAMSESLDSSDIVRNENLHLRYSFGGKIAGNSRYIMPVDQLNKLL
jgi:hypothetical protein